MSDLPVALPSELEPAFVRAFDPAGKIGAAIDALGPARDRDVLIVDASGGPVVDALRSMEARVVSTPLSSPLQLASADASVDLVVGLWSAFRGVDPGELAEVDRVLRPGGRHLAVHDYGRDDARHLRDDGPEYGPWSHRSGPFLTGGFRVRVLHCFWEFESQEATTAFLTAAFADRGAALAERLKRPRLSYNVAIYHRSRS